jgi:hypothetical protein
MANRFNETDSFINTVLTEANWTQANIKIKLNEENDGNNPNPFADDNKKKKKEDNDPNAPNAPNAPKKDDENDPNAPKKDDENDPNAPKKEDMKDSVEYGYDACPLCEATLDNDDIIFENIDSHFNSLLNVVDKVSSLQEGEDLDEGDLVVESNAPEGHCPLCESVIEDDEVLLANMNEHFDIVLEMLDEMQEAKSYKKPTQPTPKRKG